MAVERTLSILKPDAATKRNLTGAINATIEKAGLRIIAQKRIRMSEGQAEGFTACTRASVLPRSRELYDLRPNRGAGARRRERDGDLSRCHEATNPANAAPGTIRKEFAESIEANSVHGSDSLENAEREIAFFFNDQEIVG